MGGSDDEEDAFGLGTITRISLQDRHRSSYTLVTVWHLAHVQPGAIAVLHEKHCDRSLKLVAAHASHGQLVGTKCARHSSQLADEPTFAWPQLATRQTQRKPGEPMRSSVAVALAVERLPVDIDGAGKGDGGEAPSAASAVVIALGADSQPQASQCAPQPKKASLFVSPLDADAEEGLFMYG